MKPLIKNVLAIIAGWLSGSVINLVLIQIGHYLIPIEGVDPNDMEALMAVMPTLDAEYFLFPFLAHALGALIGATIAGLIAATHKMKISLCIGVLFLLGGIVVNYMVGGPTWFAILDIVVAYIPMAWFGWKLSRKILRKTE